MGVSIFVIGGGPGGYVAAIKAAQLGATVHLAEENKIGGTCLNAGCIPAKALLHTSEFYKKAKGNCVAGVTAGEVCLDWDAAIRSKDKTIDCLAGGVSGLLKANNVNVYNAKAAIASCNTVEVEGVGCIKADAIILASGSKSVKPCFPGVDLPAVIDSTQALSLEKVPGSMLIVGGGVIGVEFASLYSALGAKVTVVEMFERILPALDGQVSGLMKELLLREYVDIYTGAKLGAVKDDADGNSALVQTAAGEKSVKAEKVLLAVGRSPRTNDLGLEKAGVELYRGGVRVDENFQSNIKGIFAIGDCNAQIMLAHAASAQGEAAVEYIINGKHHYQNIIPSCIYTNPEIAFVGITEEQAISRELNYKSGFFNLMGNGKSLIDGGAAGFIKIIADAGSGKVLGVHMVGPRVTEMIGEAVLAMNTNCTVDDIIHTVHPHPTVNEAIGEAAQAVFGNSIHWPPKGPAAKL